MPRYFWLVTQVTFITLGTLVLSCSTNLPSANEGGGSSAILGSSGSGGANGIGGSGGVGVDPNAETFSVSFGPVSVEPGVEKTQCVVKRLGNRHGIHVRQIHNELSDGSHHLIVYRVADIEEQDTPFDCDPFSDTLDPAKGSPIMITQKHDELLTLPSGVAFSLGADQMIRLEMHYINAHPTETVDVAATSTFVVMDADEFKHEADFLFLGNPDIHIAPQSTQTLGPTFLTLPSLMDGSKFFGLTGHTHQWGTNVEIGMATNDSDSGTILYDVPGWQWEEPATVYLDPPVTLPEGGGFRFTCTWNNLSSESVGFGESANDEMCFFWAYYYPSQGARVCIHTDQIPGGVNGCCPESFYCDLLF